MGQVTRPAEGFRLRDIAVAAYGPSVVISTDIGFPLGVTGR